MKTKQATKVITKGKKNKRGFAGMHAEEHRKIARKGGLAVSKDRKHMAEIGRKGGRR